MESLFCHSELVDPFSVGLLRRMKESALVPVTLEEGPVLRISATVKGESNLVPVILSETKNPVFLNPSVLLRD